MIIVTSVLALSFYAIKIFEIYHFNFFPDAHQSFPILVKRPSNQTVIAGSKVIFECICVVSESVEMIWAKLHMINGTYGSGPLVHGDPHATILKVGMYQKSHDNYFTL